MAIAAPYLAPAFLVTAFGAATATAITAAVLSAVVGIGLSLAFRALGVGAPSARASPGPPQVFRQSISESFIVYGKRRVGGLMVFFHPKKVGGDHYRYFVIACAGHECEGVVSFMLGDDIVSVDGSSKVTTGKYAGAAWLGFDTGGATRHPLHATFIAECGGKWTAAHEGNEVARIYAKFLMTDDVVEAGMPNITGIIEGKNDILDSRTATVGYTNNGPLCFYDWMKLPREEGGFGAYDDEIPDDAWISAQANVADETVNGGPRYAIDAVITTGAPPAEIRDVFIVNMAGSYTYSGGKHLMRPGYWVPPSVTLSEDDLAGPIQVSPFMAADAAANEVSGTYISPDANYQAAPLTTWTTTPAPTDVRQLDVDLAFTTSKDQGDRILAIMGKRAAAEKTVTWTMNITGLKVKALDTVQLASTRYGLDNYAWSVVNWGLSPDWGVVNQLREENAEIYDDGAAVAAPTLPDLDEADPILKTSEIAELISTSSIIDPDPLTAVLTATETTISVDDHIRRYSDFQVEVFGSAGASLRLEDGDDLLLEDGGFMRLEPASSPDITGLTAGTQYHVGYDDLDRAGAAVTYTASTRLTDVSNPGEGGVSPGMHYVGTISTAAAGSGGTNTGGGATPPGYNGLSAIP